MGINIITADWFDSERCDFIDQIIKPREFEDIENLKIWYYFKFIKEFDEKINIIELCVKDNKIYTKFKNRKHNRYIVAKIKKLGICTG